ncbi:c-type cytochrome [Miltoncostaea marina]|uniref:c-type cytochrome n=1 Tax=Miltoncostaea marina TaxID=2843215 RepID=UPI001C3D6A16|nr:cytochrome c [Miltoncostaea marina]
MRTGRTAVMLLAALLAALSLAFLAGCGDDDDEGAAGTTTEATTEATAPATTEATTGGEQTNPATGGATTRANTEDEGEVEGDAAAGQQFFAATCTGCHMNNGKDAGGVGPQLAGQGLTADVVEATVKNGKGAMPPGLAQGDDLDNVVAYVVSLQ